MNDNLEREDKFANYLLVEGDDDTNLAACWQAIRNKLVDGGYLMVPEYPNPGGTIIKQDGWPVVGVWLMPDNKVQGTMEDFAGFLVPRNDLLWPLAGDVLQKVIERDRRFR